MHSGVSAQWSITNGREILESTLFGEEELLQELSRGWLLYPDFRTMEGMREPLVSWLSTQQHSIHFPWTFAPFYR